MTDGVYNLDGQCVNCGGYHPCSCEMTIEDFGIEEEDIKAVVQDYNDRKENEEVNKNGS